MPRAIAAALLLILAVSVPASAYDRDAFYPAAPVAEPVAGQTPEQAQLQDLAFFRQYLDLELAYAPAARAEAARGLDAIAARGGTLSPAAFHLALMRVVALARNGHSRLIRGMNADGKPFPRLPFLAMRFAEGYCITRAMDPVRDLAGACITAIDGMPMKEVAARLRDTSGDNDEHFAAELRTLLSLPDFLRAAGIATRADSVEIAIARNGVAEKRIVTPLPGEVFGADWTVLPIMPKPAVVADDTWSSLLKAGDQLPLYLRHPGQWFVAEPLENGRGYYVQLKQNTNVGDAMIGDFLLEAFARIRQLTPEYVVVDVRFNSGGDLTTTGKTLATLPGLLAPDGRIYVLTNGGTFSAAITSANILKQAGGNRTRLIGEHPGDAQRFWAEGSRLCLPNSKACAQFTRGLHDYTRSCAGEAGCYYTVLARDVPQLGLIPLAVNSLTPDVPVPFTFADYVAGKDLAMEAVAAEEARRKARR